MVSGPFLFGTVLPFALTSVVTWNYLQPELEQCKNLHVSWVAQLFLRNVILMLTVAGGLHLYFYVFKMQGAERKYDKHDIQRNHPRFLFSNQVRDNMFWTLASGVTVWTAYEALFFWAYANDWLWHYLDWRMHPLAFVLTFFVIVFWTSIHFHLIHRLLHWKPLFKLAHAVHHRNISLGPWSGLSMHPIEHVIYLSTLLIHVILPSHPIHVLFHLHYETLGAATGHAGYEAITFRGRPVFYLAAFHHQLHHKYLDCNYGNAVVAMDRWFGCDHDGSSQSLAGVRRRQRKRTLSSK